MNFNIRNIGRYLDVSVVMGGTTIDMGLLDENEASVLLRSLEGAADEVKLYIYSKENTND